GTALGYAMMRDRSGAGMKADRLYLMDSCYGARNGWSAAHAAQLWAQTAPPHATVTYLDGNGGNGDKPGPAMRQLLGPRYVQRRVRDHYAAVSDVLGTN